MRGSQGLIVAKAVNDFSLEGRWRNSKSDVRSLPCHTDLRKRRVIGSIYKNRANSPGWKQKLRISSRLSSLQPTALRSIAESIPRKVALVAVFPECLCKGTKIEKKKTYGRLDDRHWRAETERDDPSAQKKPSLPMACRKIRFASTLESSRQQSESLTGPIAESALSRKAIPQRNRVLLLSERVVEPPETSQPLLHL